MAQTGLVFGIKNTEARGGDGGEGYAAVMLCQPPGYSGGLVSSLVAGYKAGLVPPWENTKDEKLLQVKARMDGMMPMMKKCHKECAPEKHWYIYMLQVDPSHQGQKLGKRLLSFVFALADEQGVPTYLETVGDRNIAIYEKLGFKVVNKYPCMVGQGAKIGGPGLTEGGGMTGMKRPPSASAA
uniref:N-acetyltransferase domain-containing protein n=2 Tax=Hemiselmis tepida TaxID=464990 RepID=A0A6T6ST02_9CRYP|mmetsp:Transcript_19367/g.49051  ORF Transcript_19367/g.49051 Transcript_19367/m.49051 type:complete len:183 (+) Transcript_19367:525-1073(+)